MSVITKDEYILRSLTKVSHKRWEYFVVSRVVHKLDDPDIEFVTQQLVRRENGARALTDMYFPQFGIHLEIDEGQHFSEAHAQADKHRTEDIVSVTEHQIHRIAAAKTGDGSGVRVLTLDDICRSTDEFIELLMAKKDALLRERTFQGWDFEQQFDPQRHIANGVIHRDANVLFKRQADALRCFGYTGGDYQRGAWNVPDGSGDCVWFPRLYAGADWDNELTPDRSQIVEKAVSDKAVEAIKNYRAKGLDLRNRIVFAKAKSPLGHTLYRYVGTFRRNAKRSAGPTTVFDLVQESEEIRPPV